MDDYVDDFDTINERFRDVTEQIRATRSEQAVTQLLIAVEGFALPITPKATSTLAKSFYRIVERRGNGWRGEAGYGANYAKDVHESEGTTRDLRVPRTPATLGFFWDPSGEPKFLATAVEETLVEAERILRAEYE